MVHKMKFLKAKIRRGAKDEAGTATFPFLLFFPFFLMITLSSIELGMMSIYQVMLERGLDLTVRDLRLGVWTPTTNGAPAGDQLRNRICNYAGILFKCDKNLLVELRTVSKSTWQPLSSGATCVDRSQAVQPANVFVAGSSNEMMLIRGCLKVFPFFPTFGIGSSLPKDASGRYALVSSSAFVNEPRLGG